MLAGKNLLLKLTQTYTVHVISLNLGIARLCTIHVKFTHWNLTQCHFGNKYISRFVFMIFNFSVGYAP